MCVCGGRFARWGGGGGRGGKGGGERFAWPWPRTCRRAGGPPFRPSGAEIQPLLFVHIARHIGEDLGSPQGLRRRAAKSHPTVVICLRHAPARVGTKGRAGRYEARPMPSQRHGGRPRHSTCDTPRPAVRNGLCARQHTSVCGRAPNGAGAKGTACSETRRQHPPNDETAEHASVSGECELRADVRRALAAGLLLFLFFLLPLCCCRSRRRRRIWGSATRLPAIIPGYWLHYKPRQRLQVV